ncbi:hypothetical protein [Streptomyces sp. NPDC058657]|uniref:hypothetical protein n=1 Tax=unclassified Streptomyces TaxID=2593676 RepID=UPI00365557C4
MTTDQRPVGRIEQSALYTAAATVLLVLAVVASWSDVLLVVLGHVILGWTVGAVLLSVALVLMRVIAVRHRSTDGTAPAPRARGPRVVRGLLAATAGLGSVLGAVPDLGSEYYVLRPEGPHGCTAVVREYSVLFLGYGEVYAVGASGVAWWPSLSGSWTADDGYRPIAEGTYEMRWHQDGGVLSVSGDGVNGVMDGLHGVNCP